MDRERNRLDGYAILSWRMRIVDARRCGILASCLMGVVLVGACSKPLHLKSSSPDGAIGTVDAKVAPDASLCDDLAKNARAQFQAYVDSTSAEACQVDSDCTLLHLESLNCFAACGVLVGQGSTSAVSSAATHLCDQYFSAGCPEIRLLCPVSQPGCSSTGCVYYRPGITEPPSDGSTEGAPGSGVADAAVAADGASACSPPSVGAPCTPDQTPCNTCCTDHWTCADGVWQSQFLGCLPTSFPCGDQSCMEGVSYCAIIPALDYGELPHPALYSCESLPSPCYGPRCPSCDCLAQAGLSFSACTANAGGQVYVTF
jgi:hypothetical protein